mmetsp:Transcript_10583/g.35405  ORF Transcript_10583/g.35405 Transcript_10583/m.35405 type:complete len:394 (-) Transcript_10583:144-1325(-)
MWSHRLVLRNSCEEFKKADLLVLPGLLLLLLLPPSSSVLERVHCVDEKLHVGLRCGGLDTVPQVHDVMPSLSHLQDALCALLDDVLGAVEDRRIEVALKADVSADPPTSLVDGDGPVERDDVNPSVGHALHVCPRLSDVDDDGDIRVLLLDGVDNHLLVREGEEVVVLGGQRARPRVKDLDDLSSGLDLKVRVVSDVLGKVLQHGREEGGIIVHHLLDLEVLRAGSSLHQVGRQSERKAHEPQHSRRVSHPLAQLSEGLLDEGHGGGPVRADLHRVNLLLRPQGLQLRPARLLDVELHTHPRKGRENVGEEDASVHPVRLPRLQGDLRRDLRYLGPLPEGRVLLHELPVLLHVPARLPHHPHRCHLHLLPPGCSQEQRILHFEPQRSGTGRSR